LFFNATQRGHLKKKKKKKKLKTQKKKRRDKTHLLLNDVFRDLAPPRPAQPRLHSTQQQQQEHVDIIASNAAFNSKRACGVK
jgi:hypothetical protein